MNQTIEASEIVFQLKPSHQIISKTSSQKVRFTIIACYPVFLDTHTLCPSFIFLDKHQTTSYTLSAFVRKLPPCGIPLCGGYLQKLRTQWPVVIPFLVTDYFYICIGNNSGWSHFLRDCRYRSSSKNLATVKKIITL